jgi:3-methyladenine DNA glycosylase AlkC
MIAKIADFQDVVKAGRVSPGEAFPTIRKLAASEHWQEREVAATALVEIGKKQPDAVSAEMTRWAADPDPNVRRASCEGQRGLVRVTPEKVAPVLDALRADPSPYVRKSVANLLRDASKNHPRFVLALCKRWAPTADRNTGRVIRDGLRKLSESEPHAVGRILASVPPGQH